MTDKDKHTPPPPVAKTTTTTTTPEPVNAALPPEAYMTEQEKAAIAGSESPNRSTDVSSKKETK